MKGSETGNLLRDRVIRLAGPVGVYVLIRFASQGVAFVATLILATLLPIEAFAVIGTAFLLQAFLTPLSGLSLHHGLERLFFSYDPGLRERKIVSVFLTSLLMNTAICAVVLISYDLAFELQFVSEEQVYLTVASILLLSVQYVPIVVLRCEEKLWQFAALQLLFVTATQGAVVAAVAYSRDVDAYFYGVFAGSILGFLIWTSWLAARMKKPALVTIWPELKYALPSSPIGLLEAIQQAADRYILQLIVPSAQFGAYSLAQRFASPISTIAQATKAALYPLLYSMSDERRVATLLADATNLSILLFGVAVNAVVVTMALVTAVWLSLDFLSVFPLLVAIVSGLFLRVQEVFLGVGADIKMRLDRKLYVLAPVLCLQIGITTLLTFGFGLWGAIAAFILNGFLRLTAIAMLGQKLLPRRVDVLEYALVMLASLVPLVLQFAIAVSTGRVVGYALLASLVPLLFFAFLVSKARWTEIGSSSGEGDVDR